ncbi:MAG: NAD(P)-binding domain-containing protein [Acidimicrobiales bacterium]
MRTTVVIIGGGQAGLAMSRCLTDSSIDHVVLERGVVANSWRTERWDSLRLLTPNWMTRLPDWSYSGPDPDGFMRAGEVATFLDAYRASFDAPVVEECRVDHVEPADGGHRVVTNHGVFDCKAVVVATGACSTPKIPGIADSLPGAIRQLAPIHYLNPEQIDRGGVLVVGASASGAQIADELARDGHDVTLAVGEHTRLPRSYRGMDIHWWMDSLGLLSERYDDVEDISKARRAPSLQLVGTPERRDLDLNALSSAGVRLAGRVAGVTDRQVQFSGGFANAIAGADLKMGRLLDAIDEHATARGLDPELPDVYRPARTNVADTPLTIDLDSIGTIVWATGFAPSYPWLPPVVLDRKGAISHDGGVMPLAGMYALGLPFLRSRKSTFLDGVGPDAIELSSRVAAHLDTVAATR